MDYILDCAMRDATHRFARFAFVRRKVLQDPSAYKILYNEQLTKKLPLAESDSTSTLAPFPLFES